MTVLALKYLFSKPWQTFLMLLGIFLGACAFVVISGFLLGFREYFIDQLINTNAHIFIQAREEFLTDTSLNKEFYNDRYQHIFWDPPPSGRKDNDIVEQPQKWYQRLKADPRVIAFSPQLTAAVVFSKGTAEVTATLIGCDPLQQKKVSTIADYVIAGDFEDLAIGGNRIVIGEELKKKLGVILSQNILVSLANTTPVPFKVVGIFNTGNNLFDTTAYAQLADVQKVNNTLNEVNQIVVKLKDHTQAASLATTWSAFAPEKVESWDQQNANLFNVFKIQDAIRFLSIGAIIVVASFGIYNVLNMTVVQKRKDIAILLSMGYTTWDIVFLFFSQGLLLGITGAGLGLLSGYLLSLYLETIPFAGGPLGAGAGHLVISFQPSIYVNAALLAIFSACIASIIPAFSAGRLSPIEIIREGAE